MAGVLTRPSYRDFLQGMIIDQTMAACKEKLEVALWNMHTRIHGRFRNALQKVYFPQILDRSIGIASSGTVLDMR